MSLRRRKRAKNLPSRRKKRNPPRKVRRKRVRKTGKIAKRVEPEDFDETTATDDTMISATSSIADSPRYRDALKKKEIHEVFDADEMKYVLDSLRTEEKPERSKRKKRRKKREFSITSSDEQEESSSSDDDGSEGEDSDTTIATNLSGESRTDTVLTEVSDHEIDVTYELKKENGILSKENKILRHQFKSLQERYKKYVKQQKLNQQKQIEKITKTITTELKDIRTAFKELEDENKKLKTNLSEQKSKFITYIRKKELQESKFKTEKLSTLQRNFQNLENEIQREKNRFHKEKEVFFDATEKIFEKKMREVLEEKNLATERTQHLDERVQLQSKENERLRNRIDELDLELEKQRELRRHEQSMVSSRSPRSTSTNAEGSIIGEVPVRQSGRNGKVRKGRSGQRKKMSIKKRSGGGRRKTRPLAMKGKSFRKGGRTFSSGRPSSTGGGTISSSSSHQSFSGAKRRRQGKDISLTSHLSRQLQELQKRREFLMKKGKLVKTMMY